MSDGDGKDSVKVSSEKDCHKSGKKKTRVDDFSQAIARIAMAQVCEGLGFQSFQQSALDTLADVGVRYIRDVGRTASLRAESSNRRECNVFDVIQGLEDLGSVQGFLGASDVSHPLTGSGVVKDLRRYVGEAEEIPFAYLVPGFPVVKERRLNPSFAQAEENLPDEHIPNWLPKFPDPRTYTELDLENKKDSDAEDKLQLVNVQQPRQEDIPTENLQLATVCNGSEAGIAVEEGGVAKANRAADINPYLAPPLQFGEKEVHVPVLPPKLLNEAMGNHQTNAVMENHVSVSSFEPTVQTSEADDRRKLLLNGRPNVQFKFGNAKKPLGRRRISQNEEFEKISFWFADDHGGKDEMKRKAEQIFREKMEYSQEVSQL